MRRRAFFTEFSSEQQLAAGPGYFFAKLVPRIAVADQRGETIEIREPVEIFPSELGFVEKQNRAVRAADKMLLDQSLRVIRSKVPSLVTPRQDMKAISALKLSMKSPASSPSTECEPLLRFPPVM